MKKNIVHDAINSLIPYVGREFLFFKSADVRNFDLRFWKISPVKTNVLNKTDIGVLGEIKRIGSSALPVYEFPKTKTGETDYKAIISNGLDLKAFQTKEVNDKLEDFVFSGKKHGEFSLDDVISTVRGVVSSKAAKNAKEGTKNAIEKAFKEIVAHCNGHVYVSLEDEYGFDFTIGFRPNLKKKVNLDGFDLIEKDEYGHEPYADFLFNTEDDFVENEAKVKGDGWYVAMSRYDKEGNIRDVDSIDEVLEQIRSFIKENGKK